MAIASSRDGRGCDKEEFMASDAPILVTGAAGRVGGVGHTVVELLRQRGLPVRAFVHRRDERAEELLRTGAEIFVGDLTRGEDVVRALAGCRRVYFGMSVSEHYLEATVTTAAAARAQGDLEVFVNISQMTVSQMSLTHMTDSPQHRQHWLAEQVLNWSSLPVVHLRPTVFLENPFFTDFAATSIARDDTIRLPFGTGRTSPVAARDVAEVAARVLVEPRAHIGKVYDLTGPRTQDMNGIAGEYAAALERPIRYVNMPFEEWAVELHRLGLPAHVEKHLATMAHLHAEGRYDRRTDGVASITGRPATSVRDYVASHRALFDVRR
jgi:NAD(P)H dehydrogenase (quinone)